MSDPSSSSPDQRQNPSSPSYTEAANPKKDDRLRKLCESVTSPDPTLRKQGLQATRRIASRTPTKARPLLEPCLDALGDTDPDVRVHAAQALGEFAHAYPEPVAASLTNDHILSTFTDDVDDVRASVSRTVETISRRTPSAVSSVVPALTNSLSDSDDEVRTAGAAVIAVLAETNPDTITDHTPAIVQCLEDEAVAVRSRIAETVAAVATEHPCEFDSKLEALCRASRDSEPCVRRPVTTYLSERAPAGGGSAIRSALFERLSDDVPAIRETASTGLRRSIRRRSECSPEEIEELIDALADPVPGVRTNAGFALKHAGYEEYWRVANESIADPMTTARAILQTYRSMDDLDPYAQLVGACRCSICRQPFETPKFDHPNVVCEECATEIEPCHSSDDGESDPRESGDENVKSTRLEPSPVAVGDEKCWRQFRHGELVVMHDDHDCETYPEFLQTHFTRDGMPIQSVQF